MFDIRYGSIFSKLLTRENLQVRVSNSDKTASFDIDKRILTLPNWNADDNILNMLCGHEGSHALHTPKEYVHAIQSKDIDKQSIYAQCLNIVEDCRIDKLILRLYPGMITWYSPAQNYLIEKNFLIPKGILIDQLNIADRINVFFKTKCMINPPSVPFSDEEQKFVNKLEKLETFNEVLECATELFEMLKEEQKNNSSGGSGKKKLIIEVTTNRGQGSGSSSGKIDDVDLEDFDEIEINIDASDGNGEKSDSKEDEKNDLEDNSKKEDTKDIDGDKNKSEGSTNSKEKSDNSEENEDGNSTKESKNSKENKDQDGNDKESDSNSDGSGYSLKPIVIITVKNLAEKLQSIAKVSHGGNVDISKIDHPESYTKKYDWPETDSPDIPNKDELSSLISIFERKKKAKDYRKTRESASGTLDMSKLMDYKFSEHIFKVNEINSDMKNHGFFMIVDCSGSMDRVFSNVIKQVTLLSIFCKKMNIPFVVYGFTDSYSYLDKKYGFEYYSRAGLVRFYDNSMTINKINRTQKSIRNMSLGGTPLNEAMVISLPLVEKFKKNNKVDICNFILLSDGCGQTYQKDTRVTLHQYGVSSFPECSFAGFYDMTSVAFEIMKKKMGVIVHTYFITDAIPNIPGKSIPPMRNGFSYCENIGNANHSWYLDTHHVNRKENSLFFTKKFAEKIA